MAGKMKKSSGVPKSSKKRLCRKPTAMPILPGPTKKMRDLSFSLVIKTTNTSPQRGFLMNRFEEPDSKILSISSTPVTVYNARTQEHEDVSDAELKAPGFVGSYIILFDELVDDTGNRLHKTQRTFTNKKGYFTCMEVISLILKFERIHRPKTKWFGGVDCHHTYYEGLHGRDHYTVSWGS